MHRTSSDGLLDCVTHLFGANLWNRKRYRAGVISIGSIAADHDSALEQRPHRAADIDARSRWA